MKRPGDQQYKSGQVRSSWAMFFVLGLILGGLMIVGYLFSQSYPRETHPLVHFYFTGLVGIFSALSFLIGNILFKKLISEYDSRETIREKINVIALAIKSRWIILSSGLLVNIIAYFLTSHIIFMIFFNILYINFLLSGFSVSRFKKVDNQ